MPLAHLEIIPCPQILVASMNRYTSKSFPGKSWAYVFMLIITVLIS
jgi:hypothetical protein